MENADCIELQKPTTDSYKESSNTLYDRCSSPVISSNTSHRKMINSRKRKMKGRTNLATRFMLQQEQEDTIDVCKGFAKQHVGDRLIKIREFVKANKKHLDDLYKLSKACENKPESFIVDTKPMGPYNDLLLQKQHFFCGSPLDTKSGISCSLAVKSNECEKENVLVTDPKFKGFYTGMGKNIVVSYDSIKKNSKLFDDILKLDDVIGKEDKSNSYLSLPELAVHKSNMFDCKNNVVNQSGSFTNTPEMQTDISDTQMILAADTAVHMMEQNQDEIDLVRRKEFTNNGLAKDSNKEIKTRSTLEYEMAELEKILSEDNVMHPETVNDFEFLNANLTVSQVDKHESECFKGFDKCQQNFTNKINENFKTVIRKYKSDLYITQNKRFKLDYCYASLNNVEKIKGKYDLCSKSKSATDINVHNEIPKFNEKFIGSDEAAKETESGISCQFKKASGKPFEVLPQNPQHMSKKICETDFKINKKLTCESAKITSCNSGFSTAKGENCKDVGGDVLCQFKKASGKPLDVLPDSLKNAQQMFKQICETEDSIEFIGTNKKNFMDDIKAAKSSSNTNSAGFSTAGGKTIKMSDNAWNKAKSIFTDENLTSVVQENVGFTSAKTKVPSVNSHQIDVNYIAKEWFEDDSQTWTLGVLRSTENTKPFNSPVLKHSSEVGNGIRSAIKESHDRRHLQIEAQLPKELIILEDNIDNEQQPSIVNTLPRYNKNPAKARSAKRKLGISPCKQILTSEEKLRRAKLLFEEYENSKQSKSTNTSTNVSVSCSEKLFSSTPVKEFKKIEKIEAAHLPQITAADLLINTNITPLKHNDFKQNMDESKNLAIEHDKCWAIIIQEPTAGNTKNWIENISREYEELLHKLKIISERKRALEAQQRLIENAKNVQERYRPGALFQKKQALQRILLTELIGDCTPGSISVNEAIALNVPRQVLEVTPKNAEYIHFNSIRWNKCEENNFTVCTTNGARVIPNSNNLIGLAEIESAFETMSGIDSKLLPKGWIANHFKWIVWKLASLERNFPDRFTECLSLENVMQQLHYRYNREIDQAERPALRRILEKDDVPQKRMVLCVADIIKISGSGFELVLTDGWYCIQTTIDQPLCNQINTSKIVVGTKLIVQCADILNCDGCHPLEVPSDVRLKINYNCTRRALWNLKLGYQKIAKPFCIPLRTIHPEGGLVGCIKIYVVRVYPLTYVEKQVGKRVWRNKKAEENREREWANEKRKELETIHYKVKKDYETEINHAHKSNILGKVSSTAISGINSPKELYEILESTNDPEGFKKKLSPSQIASVAQYKADMCVRHQQELAIRVAEQAKKLKCSRRNVFSILKLRVLDATETSQDSYILNVWNSTEEHLQLLKEGCSFSVYYIFPRHNGELTANTKTLFQPEPMSLTVTHKTRQIVSISVLQQLTSKPLFNEFDTVGTVVQVHKNTHCQELWLTDSSGRLLLVKIFETPESCCLVDNISRGQNIVLMNLIFCEAHDNTGQAIANQCTIITGYPQLKLLRDSLASYCEQLPKDLVALMDECDKKISRYYATARFRSSLSAVSGSSTMLGFDDLLDDSSESTIIPSRLTSIDVAMSLIDTDQYFEKA